MLPIGSIVYLKEGTKKVMILNRGPLIENNNMMTIFDYSGCIYPLGLVPDKVLYFNEENIDKTVFEGYYDNEEERFKELFLKWKEDKGTEIVKGHVDKKLEM